MTSRGDLEGSPRSDQPRQNIAKYIKRCQQVPQVNPKWQKLFK